MERLGVVNSRNSLFDSQGSERAILKMRCFSNAATTLFLFQQEVQDTCAARECKSCESPSTDRFDYSFNSTFDAQEGPVLHDVSLAEAASFSAINGKLLRL